MHVLHNKTPYAADTFVLLDQHGTNQAVAIIKGTFIYDGEGLVKAAPDQIPLCYADDYYGKPGGSSVRYASDLVFEKRGTDIVLNGHAYAPHGRAVRKLDTALMVGAHMKHVRVYGDRVWHYRLGVVTKTPPVPFVKMPLVYERAFGGADTSPKKKKKQGHCLENPVGTGFRTARTRKSLHGHPLPNLEWGTHPIQRWKDKPAPAGYGFIAPYWEPRASRSGTYDDEWERRRMPLLPEDFDPGFYNAGSSGFALAEWLKGDEPVALYNLHPDHEKLHFTLPGITMSSAFILDDQTYKPDVRLDTLLIEPDESRLSMVWRATFPKPDRLDELRQVTVTHEG
ncbi:DUF2169 family type VI secretion system accessory protein [Desulfoluna spongiiphila]|uniref:DUF2169 domain-containing protein n=1 Tax=Desulfoluna spongiiphila TaxID=419481 RepID=A0A1G5E1H1_9BACT|nr:DUF2169 domain-containing protein [Desulfoluna spongiiphila]SCY20812.1 hypothetical protein SAMN05216233_105117 [Desulfoluna spongiiphila]